MVLISKKLSKAQIEALHQDILTIIRQSYPSNGYKIVSVSTSSTSESLYAYVMYKRRLYYLRFAAHHNEIKGHSYATFNLLNYTNWTELRTELRRYFNVTHQTNAYHLMSYHNFIWLALIYRCSTNPAFKVKFEPADEIRKVTIYMHNQIFAEITNKLSVRRLIANLLMGLVYSNSHIDRIYLKEPVFLNITPSGIKILNYFPEVSKYGTDRRWITDPRLLTTTKLVSILNNID